MLDLIVGQSSVDEAEMMNLQIANVLSFMICLYLNGNAEIGNNGSVGIQAAGFTFAIWGIIYLLLAMFVVY